MNNQNIIIIGNFDLFHIGHLRLITKVKFLPETTEDTKIIIALPSDQVALSEKRQPIIIEEQRLEMIKGQKYVDDAFLYQSPEAGFTKALQYSPKMIIVDVEGSKLIPEEYINYCKAKNIEIRFLDRTPDISTSAIIEKIRNAFQ